MNDFMSFIMMSSTTSGVCYLIAGYVVRGPYSSTRIRLGLIFLGIASIAGAEVWVKGVVESPYVDAGLADYLIVSSLMISGVGFVTQALLD